MSQAIAKREAADVLPRRQMDALQRIAAQITDPKHIRTRKGRGGQVFKYVDGAYVIRALNEAFIHDWDFEADNEQIIEFNGQPFEVRCRGRLTVRLEGRTVTKVQYGSQPIEHIKDKQGNIIAPVTIGDCFKGAATDALKKCASMLGVALDLYDSDFKPSDLAGYSVEPPPVDDYEAVLNDAIEPEPVRDVKLEGAKPAADAHPGQLPELKGTAGQVTALAKALKWDSGMLVQAIEEKFGLIISPGKLADTLEFMGANEHRELVRILKARLQGNGGRK